MDGIQLDEGVRGHIGVIRLAARYQPAYMVTEAVNNGCSWTVDEDMGRSVLH